MKRVFLDCGAHLCEGMVWFYNEGIIDESFFIHMFEANPSCRIKERSLQYPLAITSHEVAVWVEDGEIEFSQENWEKSNSGSPRDEIGGSTTDGWGSSVLEVKSRFSNTSREPSIKVPSIDFSKFVNQFDEKDFIICKMDIEGSEFKVLRKMIKDGSIDKINTLYIEWHEKWLEDEDENSRKEIIEHLSQKDIKVINWG